MIREVTLGRRMVGDGGALAELKGESVGGDEAALPSSIGSIEGESLRLPLGCRSAESVD